MTTIYRNDIIAKIRRAIDDIVPSATDSFTDDTNDELWQAVEHAVEQLLMELPADALIPEDGSALTVTQGPDGTGYISLPADSPQDPSSPSFLRFISLKFSTWLSPVYTLIEPGSDEQMRQRSSWGRGTPEKPRAMLDGTEDSPILRFWSVGKTGNPPSYDYTVEILNYIPMPTVNPASTDPQSPTDANIVCALKPVAVKAVIYRAASIFFDGKKEPETADKFRNI